MAKTKIFLASSGELVDDRREFEIFINRKNKDWHAHGAFLELIVWEDFLDALSPTRLQDEYNAAIRACDIFLMLFCTKVGRYSEEEFATAVAQFRASGRPLVYTYFKDPPPGPGSARGEDLMSVWAFQEKLGALGHFYTVYKNVDELKYKFNQQLDKLAAGGAIRLVVPERVTSTVGSGRPAPFQAPLPAADHVPRIDDLDRLRAHLLAADGELLPLTVGLHGFGGVGKTTLARLFCADAAVRRACRDGILWVTLGKNPASAHALISDLVAALTGETNGCQTLSGARAQLQAVLRGRQLLLVLDDVWDEAKIRELSEASAGCARLITTRNTNTLPFDALVVELATMHNSDSRQLLGAGLPGGQGARLITLAEQLGGWPVLLRLANRTLRQRVLRQKTPLDKALDAVAGDLQRRGVCAFDPVRDVAERDQAVAATVDASLELLDPDDRQRYAELAIFAQDVALPLSVVDQLWQITAGLDAGQAERLVGDRLAPLALVEYDGSASTLRLHDVLRSYLLGKLADPMALHGALAGAWGDYPQAEDAFAWRWLAFHRAQAALHAEPSARHAHCAALVALVGNAAWQQAHENALGDLPALREALHSALHAVLDDDHPLGVALLVRAVDSLRSFQRAHGQPRPILALARLGELDGARRRSTLLPLDEYWRQVLLLVIAWLAAPLKPAAAACLADEVHAELGPQAVLQDLWRWIAVDLHAAPPPDFAFPVPPNEADERLIEELLKRVGGGEYSRELIVSRGLDPDVQNPDRPQPTRGIYRERIPGLPEGVLGEQTKTGYLADLDGPYLVAYAAGDPVRGSQALAQYLSVYSNYHYPEYRLSTLWLLLGYVVRYPRADGGAWVREAVVSIVESALGGGSVEFEQGVAIAVEALRAQAGDARARQGLVEQAQQLMAQAACLKPGRERAGSDVWAQHKRLMLASAQALGWLLGDTALAEQILHDALGLADSGFAGYQAPACLALAEAILVCRRSVAAGDLAAAAQAIDSALEWAQRAAHNVQDPSFCARMTARVNAMRAYWWTPFVLDERLRRLPQAAYLREFSGLHRVGHVYTGRRADALEFPDWAREPLSFARLQRLYQRPHAGFVRLNGGEPQIAAGESLAVPDPGLIPHIAARLAAEILAQAGQGTLSPRQREMMRALVPYALTNLTALDAVLTRLVLASGRRSDPPTVAEVEALSKVLAQRPAASDEVPTSELIAGRLT